MVVFNNLLVLPSIFIFFIIQTMANPVITFNVVSLGAKPDEKTACGPGHGISIGSLGKDLRELGVQNVTVRKATFTGTQNGAIIKTWGRPSSGFVFQHVTMANVQNPIVIDQNYCPNNKNCPGQFSGVKIRDVTHEDVHGTSATKVAVRFDCSKKNPCSGTKLEGVKLTCKSQQIL